MQCPNGPNPMLIPIDNLSSKKAQPVDSELVYCCNVLVYCCICLLIGSDHR